MGGSYQEKRNRCCGEDVPVQVSRPVAGFWIAEPVQNANGAAGVGEHTSGEVAATGQTTLRGTVQSSHQTSKLGSQELSGTKSG